MSEITVGICESFKAIGIDISETDLNKFEQALYKRGLNVAPRAASNPSSSGSVELASFGTDRKRSWILKFEDADRDDMFFESERAAHAMYEKASITWNCTLLETSQRKYAMVCGKLEPLSGGHAQTTPDRKTLDELIQRHASAYVARGGAISDSIIAECKASHEALLAALSFMEN